MPTEDFLDRFSKLDRALRVLAYVHQFVQRCRRQSPLYGVRLEAQDVAAAEQLMTTCTQRRYFSEEYRCLSEKRPVPAASSILSLNPFLGKNGSSSPVNSSYGKLLSRASTATRKYTFDELSTLLARVEACLYYRPQSLMSEDPTDLLALTPWHFLVGGPLLSIVESEVNGESKSILNRWKHLKHSMKG